MKLLILAVLAVISLAECRYTVDLRTTEEPEQMCEPYATFNDYCNACKCSSDGKKAACTLMACDPSVWNKDGTLKHEAIYGTTTVAPDPLENEVESNIENPDLICNDARTFNYYCNTCECAGKGYVAACTAIGCEPEDAWNKDGTLKYELDSTTTEQPEIIEEESEQVCEPNSEFNEYCNSCRCSADGKSVACTLISCDDDFWNKDGTLKEGY